MPWTSQARRLRLPPDWPTRRAHVLHRDHHTCRIHGPRCIVRATEADHIEAGDDHSLANLQAACSPCHRDKTANEGGTAWARARQATRHPTEPHPGEHRP